MDHGFEWKKVLVTGGAGFIGSHLVHSLLEAGLQVRVFDNFSTGRYGNLRPHDGLQIIRGDVRDLRGLVVAAADCDMGFHLAGIVGMRLAHALASESYEISQTGTANFLRATQDCPCVLFSSSSVYGLRSNELCRESDRVELEGGLAFDGGCPGYACGKLVLEQLGLDAAAHGRDVLIVRPFNVVGPGQQGEYGMVLPTFIAQALAGAAMTVYGDGGQCRCFSDVTVFVRTLLTLLSLPAKSRLESQIVNLGTSMPTRVLDLAWAVLKVAGIGGTIQHVQFQAVFPGRVDVQYRVPCTRRVDDLIGKICWPDIETTVERSLESLMLVDRSICGARSSSQIARVGAWQHDISAPPT